MPLLRIYSIGDNRNIDGGYRRNENANLAAGYERVLVLSPFGGRSRAPLDWGMHFAARVDELRARGSQVETILPDNGTRRWAMSEFWGSGDPMSSWPHGRLDWWHRDRKGGVRCAS